MTTNEPPNQFEWSIRVRLGVDSGQWDWGIMNQTIRDSLECFIVCHVLMSEYVFFNQIVPHT